MSTREFSLKATKDSSFVQFLVSYVKNSEATDAKEINVRREFFLLFHQVLSEVKLVPEPLLDWRSLADLSRIYARSKVLSLLLIERLATRDYKAYLIVGLEHKPTSADLKKLLTSVVTLKRVC